MKSKYETDPKIKQELLTLVKWQRANDVNHNWETPEQVLDDYLAERDVALVGDLRVIQKVSTRNANKELLIAVVASLAGIGIAILVSLALIKYF